MSATPGSLQLSLVSHTNVGKTTLARTLLGRDVGEVRDAPHVTEFADAYEMLRTPQGETLRLWDTPGFGDSVRLLRRMQQSGNPLGWFLSQVWDRWRDRPFWASQQALRHVAETTDVVLYLVSAAEEPQAAAYVASEMALLRWVGKPVIVLLNQLGMPREAALEQAEAQRWREHLAPFEPVAQVLPLDAFARCWVQEGVLLQAIEQCLQGEPRALMQRLCCGLARAAAWRATDAAVDALAQSMARLAAARQELGDVPGLRSGLRKLGAALGLRADEQQPGAAGPGGAGRSARRRGARQHHAADRAARPGGPGAGRDPAAHGQPLPADAAHGRKQGGADRRRAHRRAGRAEGRHRRRRADAGRRAARRRPARCARRAPAWRAR